MTEPVDRAFIGVPANLETAAQDAARRIVDDILTPFILKPSQTISDLKRTAQPAIREAIHSAARGELFPAG